MRDIEHLRQLALEESVHKCTSLPANTRTIHRCMDKTANGLTRCIIDFLRFSVHQGERIAVAGRYVGQTKVKIDVLGHSRRIDSGRWIPPSMTIGRSDISAVIHEQAIRIEVKVGKDRQSQAQRLYQEQF